jgi:hypothetical protein
MIKWIKDFIQTEKKDRSSLSALLPATTIQIAEDESPESPQFESVPGEPQAVRMEEKECQISLVSDTITQDTERSEPPTSQSIIPCNQEDFFVWIKNPDNHMENRKQFLRSLLSSFRNVLSLQIFQESSELLSRSAVLEKELKLLLLNSMKGFSCARSIVLTFKRVPEKVATGDSKIKASIVSDEASEESGIKYEEEESQEPRA